MVSTEQVTWVAQDGSRWWVPLGGITEVTARERWSGLGKLTIRHAAGEHELTGISPENRAEAIGELVRTSEARHARQRELAPSSPAERQAALRAAIVDEVQKGYQVAYEGQFEAVLVSSAAWRTHHGAHAVGTLLTLGGWSLIWGTQAARSAASRKGLVLAVDERGRVQSSERVEATLKRLANESLNGPPSPVPAPTSADHQRCPDCAEEVLTAARICRFCRHEFEAA